MNPERPDARDYQVGGSLKPNAFYVWRKADEDLFEFLNQGEFCYIFNCRQMGKSSLRVKAMERFKAEGISCGAIDLTNIGKNAVTPEKWYGGIISELHRAFKLIKQVNLKNWLAEHQHLSPLQQLRLYLEDVILAHVNTERIVIFIDEIDSVLSLSFRVDDFFALIRSCYNQRAENAAHERLTFVLLGVATPSDLVQDIQQAPFNIGRAIALEGLEFEKSGILAEGLVEKAENSQQLLREILQWTGGQPFLTQKLCQIVQNQVGEVIRTGEEADKIQQLVQAKILDNWEFQDDPQHLKTIRDRLFKDEQKAGRLLGLYQQILDQGSVIVDGSAEQMDLKLSGLAVKRGDRLVVYNPIYQEIFNRNWLEEELTKLRPAFYAEAIKSWLASNKQDESYLVRGQALLDVQEWAKGKSLGDEDYQFLRASEQLETVVEREKKRLLIEANKKAINRVRIGSLIFVLMIIASGVAVLLGENKVQEFQQKANQAQQREKSAYDRAENARQEAIKYKKQKESQQKILEENRAELKQAQQQSRLALGQLAKARESQQQAQQNIQLAQAELSRIQQQAQKNIQLAQAELSRIQQQTSQKLAQAQQQLKESNYQVKIAQQEAEEATNKQQTAESEYQVAKVNLQDLDIRSASAEADSQFENNQKTQALITALKAGKQLKQLNNQASVESQMKVLAALKKTVYGVTELNSLNLNESIWGISFSPDGKVVATAVCDSENREKNITLWRLNGQLIRTLKGSYCPFKLSFSPDGRLLAAAEADGIVKLWRLDNGQLFKKFPSHPDLVSSVSFSPDGQMLVSADASGIIKLWSIQGQELKTITNSNLLSDEANKNPNWIESVKFSPNGKMIAAAGNDKKIKLWDLQGNLLQTFEGHNDKIYSLDFNPDGQVIASGSADKTIKLWLVKNGKEFRTFKGHTSTIYQISLSPDGQTIASGSTDKTIKLWNVSDGQERETFTEHGADIKDLDFSPDGNTLVSGSFDGTVKFWSLNRNDFSPLRGHRGDVYSTSISPDGKVIASAGQDGKIKLWSPEGELLKTLKGHEKSILSLSFSPDGQILASGSSDKTIKLWSVKEGRELKILSGHEGKVSSLSFSPDGNLLASGDQETSDQQSGGTIKLWNVKDGRVLKSFKGDWVMGISFSPDGKKLASSDGNGKINLWDLQGFEVLPKRWRGNLVAVSRLRFSPDGKTIAAGTGDFKINLWDLEGGSKPLKTFAGHSGDVWDVSFSPDGKVLASASYDNTIKLWNVEDGKLLRILRGHEYVVRSVSFSPDGKFLASGGMDDAVILWQLDSEQGRVLWDVTVDELLARGCHWLRDYFKLNPEMNEREGNPCSDVPPDWLAEGEELAKTGKFSEAIVKLQQAKLQNPELDFDPEAKARNLAAKAKLELGKILVQQGKVRRAIIIYAEVQKLDLSFQLSDGDWNHLCWEGSLYGYSQEVLFACDQAVELDSADGLLLDSRALARALSGDTKNAVVDFQGFLKWIESEFKKNQAKLEKYQDGLTLDGELQKDESEDIKKYKDLIDYRNKLIYWRDSRQAWIKALRAGQNPFTPELIDYLKIEHLLIKKPILLIP
jgi:WD40 repeat protein